MKNLFWVLVLSVLTWSQAWGQELTNHQQWIEQVDGGLVVSASPQAARNYALGFGGDVMMGYRFTSQWSLSADLGYYKSNQNDLEGASGQWAYTPLMAVARYSIGSGWLRPYFLLGAGLVFNSYSLTGISGKESQTQTDLLASPGVGFLWVVASDMAVYLQGRADLNFAPNHPGIPFADNPTLFIPVTGGISFFAL